MPAFPITDSQAAFLTKLSSARSDYLGALNSLQSSIDRDKENLANNYHTRGVSHQSLNEVVSYHSAFTTLIEIAHDALGFDTREEFDRYFNLATTPDDTQFLGRIYFRSSLDD